MRSPLAKLHQNMLLREAKRKGSEEKDGKERVLFRWKGEEEEEAVCKLTEASLAECKFFTIEEKSVGKFHRTIYAMIDPLALYTCIQRQTLATVESIMYCRFF